MTLKSGEKVGSSSRSVHAKGITVQFQVKGTWLVSRMITASWEPASRIVE